jgi:hypothetical protein
VEGRRRRHPVLVKVQIKNKEFTVELTKPTFLQYTLPAL